MWQKFGDCCHCCHRLGGTNSKHENSIASLQKQGIPWYRHEGRFHRVAGVFHRNISKRGRRSRQFAQAFAFDSCCVFRDVMTGNAHPFHLYTVSNNTAPIRAGGGMKIVPDYTFANAPAPKVIVIPAQSEPSKAMLDWIRQSSQNADVTMSVCTGAFVLAKTGLLDGKSATTFHAAFNRFAMEFPKIQLKRGARFVENGNLATAGGLSSGIDLALRVVERYYGREVATQTAYTMEYQGQGWMDPDSNQVYAVAPVSTAEHPVCPVCGMDVNPATSPKSVFKGKTYYFCSEDDEKVFDSAPEKFVTGDKQL